jgi:hypothetical protein
MKDRYSATGRPPFDAKIHCHVCLGMGFHPIAPFGTEMHAVLCEECDATGRKDKNAEKVTEERMLSDVQKITAAIKSNEDYLAADQERVILIKGSRNPRID